MCINSAGFCEFRDIIIVCNVSSTSLQLGFWHTELKMCFTLFIPPGTKFCYSTDENKMKCHYLKEKTQEYLSQARGVALQDWCYYEI